MCIRIHINAQGIILGLFFKYTPSRTFLLRENSIPSERDAIIRRLSARDNDAAAATFAN